MKVEHQKRTKHARSHSVLLLKQEFLMPKLEFKGKQFVYSHHLGVPFRELQVVPEKSLPAAGKSRR
ncbi:hypothetical protein [Thiopseudomonas acetoxidans]|uniref:Uncharacterized protein n=1 Tax=Thiopseudomonas acetoxidans TaxID=3041622 RepID=A0ABT7SKU5_9GAMM|nr:hypothetical protein [Thiopseudomonas sp. CY1220]MDM7856807.1 hypothetical protein [Thiopseudomonas sp. CY1220]